MTLQVLFSAKKDGKREKRRDDLLDVERPADCLSPRERERKTERDHAILVDVTRQLEPKYRSANSRFFKMLAFLSAFSYDLSYVDRHVTRKKCD